MFRRFFVCLVLFVVALPAVHIIRAAPCPTGDVGVVTGGDIISNNTNDDTCSGDMDGSVASVTTAGGNITSSNTNNGSVAHDMDGSVASVTSAGGNITNNNTNNGSVAGDMIGGVASVTSAGGDITINNINNGSVAGDVTGSIASVTSAGGNITNTIIINGNVGGDVTGSIASVTSAGGNITNTVVLESGSVGGIINGGIANAVVSSGTITNTLVFAQTITDDNEWARLKALLPTLLPSAGTVTINGITYEYENFDQLLDQLTLALRVTWFAPGDERVDPRPGDHIAAYCNLKAGTVSVYLINGNSVGQGLTSFAINDLRKAGQSGITHNLGAMGAVSLSVDGQNNFWLAWNGGPLGANGQGDFAKGFVCQF